LLAKYFSGNCNEAEKLQIERWKSANAANEEIFQEYQVLWDHSKTNEGLFTPNTDEALHRINLQLDLEGSSQSKSNKVIRMMYYTKRIAAILIIAAGFWLVYTMLHQRSELPSFVEIATLQGEKKEVVLPDSSHIWLNSQSKLRYEAKFVAKERKVYLEGEAYFEVFKNPSRPFVIEAGNSITRVLGTAFNLRARKFESTVVVTVTEGKVAFTGKEATERISLTPGDRGILKRSNQLQKVENEDPNFLAWKTGKLVFRNTPLKQVTSTLTDFYGRTIKVENAGKADIPFTSTFDHQSLQDVITILEMSLSVKADTVNHIIVLK
jgi:ferric-dicitrate binding protein FerR (iron transport regulator)